LSRGPLLDGNYGPRVKMACGIDSDDKAPRLHHARGGEHSSCHDVERAGVYTFHTLYLFNMSEDMRVLFLSITLWDSSWSCDTASTL
jgi:hypothetical protein